jgi:hypothetical protein
MGGSPATDQQVGLEDTFKPLDVKNNAYETISDIFNQGFLRVCGMFTSDVFPTCFVPNSAQLLFLFWIKKEVCSSNPTTCATSIGITFFLQEVPQTFTSFFANSFTCGQRI